MYMYKGHGTLMWQRFCENALQGLYMLESAELDTLYI